jgi:hypothetical protein
VDSFKLNYCSNLEVETPYCKEFNSLPNSRKSSINAAGMSPELVPNGKQTFVQDSDLYNKVIRSSTHKHKINPGVLKQELAILSARKRRKFTVFKAEEKL